jgi:hypothetical protein
MDEFATPVVQCKQWDVIDIAVEGPAGLEDPFGVLFGAVFEGPNNTILKVPGFYNGETSFVLRFSPPATGAWHYETYADTPELAGLRGTVEGLLQDNPQRRGGIVLKKGNPQHFYYEDGTPYFLLAFELDWLTLVDEGADDTTNAKRLIDQMAEYKFNQVVMNVFANDISWQVRSDIPEEYDFGNPKQFPFGGTNSDPDFSTLDTKYFQHLDHVVRYLDEKGVVAHIMIYVWNKKVNWPAMYSEADNRYFDYVVARYQASPNVIWDVSKEALLYGRCDMDYVTERIQRIRKDDAFKRLVTVHDYAYCSKHPEEVDFISIQSWNSGLQASMNAIRERYSDQPIFNIEHGGYEEGPCVVFPGDYTDPEVCLRRNYECIFAGTYSTYYWQCTSWSVVITDPMGLPEDQRPHFEYYKHLVELFERYEFTSLKPVSGHASSTHCLSNGEDQYLFLCPPENFAFHVHDIQQDVKITWFNPLTGEYLDMGEETIGEWQEFRSPWDEQMAILVLDSVKK